MEHNNYKILAINFGSTSTKIAVYAGEEKLLEHGFLHSCEDMEGVSTMEIVQQHVKRALQKC